LLSCISSYNTDYSLKEAMNKVSLILIAHGMMEPIPGPTYEEAVAEYLSTGNNSVLIEHFKRTKPWAAMPAGWTKTNRSNKSMTDPSGRFKARMVPVSMTGGKNPSGSDSGLRPRSAKSRSILPGKQTKKRSTETSSMPMAPVPQCSGAISD